MSDQENFNENPTPVDPNTAPEPLQGTQEQSVRELRDVPVEAVPTEELPDVAKEIKEGESEDARAARRQTEAILNKPIEAIEDAVNEADALDHPQTRADVLPHHVGNTTVIRAPFLRREIVVNQPVYTVVFGTLAVITIIEVALAEFAPDGWLLTLILAALSVSKAVLVMWFYMHLKDDSRIFAFAITLPIIVALVATLFLSAVPPYGY
jgi:caa(3)-type oxidase subunit IV